MKTIIALSLMAGAVAFAAPDMPRPGHPAPGPQGPGMNKPCQPGPGMNKPCPGSRPGQDMRHGNQVRPDMPKHGIPGSRGGQAVPPHGGNHPQGGHPGVQPKDPGPQPMPMPPHGPAPRR